jgi:magnesium chelatase family protein
MNPCPCGNLGHPDKACTDTSAQVARYRGKISGPLLDRIDMHIEVPPLRFGDLLSEKSEESTHVISLRVNAARRIQKARFQAPKTNSQMANKELKAFCRLDSESIEIMRQAIDVMGISARAHDRILRVARTIADLEGSPNITQTHLMEAIHFRQSSSH